MSVKTIMIYTIQMGSWRLAAERKIKMLDITAKSSNPCFAPDYSVVMDYKNGKISESEYTELYTQRMRNSLRHNPSEWEKLKDFDTVAIACYCKPDTFCHRHLFVAMMQKYLEATNYAVQLLGEIRNEKSSDIGK